MDSGHWICGMRALRLRGSMPGVRGSNLCFKRTHPRAVRARWRLKEGSDFRCSERALILVLQAVLASVYCLPKRSTLGSDTLGHLRTGPTNGPRGGPRTLRTSPWLRLWYWVEEWRRLHSRRSPQQYRWPRHYVGTGWTLSRPLHCSDLLSAVHCRGSLEYHTASYLRITTKQ